MAFDDLVIRLRAAGARLAAADINSVATATGRLAASSKSASRSGIAMGRNMRMVGAGMTRGITLPIVGIGAAAVKMSTEFESAMTRVVTQAGLPQRELAGLSRSVLDLARDSRYGPLELAEGMYHAESVLHDGARALRALRVAQEGATLGNADLSSTTSALVGAIRTGIPGVGNFRRTMAELVATVGAGNMSMNDLTKAFGTGILPTAKVAGLGLTDVNGALAVFTDENKAGSSAMAELATALHYLYAPTDKGEKALHKMGLSGRRLAEDLNKPRGLLTALTDLRDHIRQSTGQDKGPLFARSLAPLLPGGRGRILITLMNQLDVYRSKMDQINHTIGRYDQSVKDADRTTSVRFHKALSTIQVDLIELGDTIKPVLIPIVEGLAHAIDSVTQWFDHLSPGTKRFIVIAGLAIAVLGPLLSIMGAMVIAISALLDPVVLIVAGIAALAAGAIYAYTHWKWFRDIVDALWGALRAGWTVIKWTGDRLADLIYIIAHPAKDVSTIWDWLKKPFVDVLNWIIRQLDHVIDVINKVSPFGDVGHIGQIDLGGPPRGVVIHQRPQSAFRGGARSGQWAPSHGPFSTPTGRAPMAMAGGVIENHITLNVDGKKMATAVHRAAVQKRSTK